MSNQTYHDLDKQLIKLFEEKEYQQVLAVVEQEQANFPTHLLDFLYWRISIVNLLGKQELALQLFRTAIEQGSWFVPDWMVQDEDLASLRPLPEFQELLSICRQHQAAAQAKSCPDLLVIPSDPQIATPPMLITLHGNMGNMHDTAEEWCAITTRGWLLAVPQSSQMIGQTAYVWNDRERGVHEVCTHFAALNEKHAVDPGRVLLGGFSKGGGLAIWMALHQLVPVRGFVVLGPSLTNDEFDALSSLLTRHKPTGIRGFIIAGEEDKHCLQVSRQVLELMRTHKLPCELEILPGLGHEYPPDFSEYVAKGLAFVEQK